MLTKKPPQRPVQKTHYNAHVIAWLVEQERDRKRARNARWCRENPEKKQMGHRRWRLSSLYGLSEQAREDLFATQGRRCICGAEPPSSSRGWHTDHDHVTGKVRGILCRHCNSALGHAKDNPTTLRALADYLERN